MRVITTGQVQQILAAAQDRRLIEDQDTLVFVLNWAVLTDRIARLKAAFPAETLHAIAIKTNPLVPVLRHLHQQGAGLEAASLGELHLARAAGIPDSRIVFDSPAKTAKEIEWLHQQASGIRVNADSLAELHRHQPYRSCIRLGLRINPLIESASTGHLQAAGARSKFGEPITRRAEILCTCAAIPQVDCFHVHIGSQYADARPTVAAIRTVVDLATELNHQLGRQQITTIDIGGGFPVNYHPGQPYRIEEFAKTLSQVCPELFSGQFRLVTEFGRYIHAQAAVAITDIEYVKEHVDGSVTAITHAGADLFVRECYQPQMCHHEFTVLNATPDSPLPFQSPESTDHLRTTHIAGPLCFGGDMLVQGIQLPPFAPGDKLLIHDVGANTFALFSRHCSRPFPQFLAWDDTLGIDSLRPIKARETYDQVVEFWR